MIKTPKWQPIPKMAGYLTTTYGMNFKVTELTVVPFSVPELAYKKLDRMAKNFGPKFNSLINSNNSNNRFHTLLKYHELIKMIK